MRAPGHMLSEALMWVVRLPLLGDIELAALLRIHELDARRLRFELEQRGWVEWITAGVPGLDRERRFTLLRATAAEPLAQLLGIPLSDLAQQFSIRRSDLLSCVLRHATIAGLNRLFASIGETLADARVLPSRPRPGDRWWPPGVDAYGALRLQGADLPFFVVWDRAAATDGQRRRRVQRWATSGSARVSVLVVAAGPREAEVWAEAARRSEVPAPVWIATSRAVLEQGGLEAPWRNPLRGTSRLVAALTASTAPVRPPTLPAEVTLPRLSCDAPLLRSWAPRHAAQQGSGTLQERLAAVALSTSADDRCVAEWLVRHPSLTGEQLGVLVDTPVMALTRRIEWLSRCALVRAVRVPEGGHEALLPTRLAVRWLAAEGGTTPRVLERQAGLTAALVDGDPPAHPRFAHDLGVNATFVRLHADARRAGGTLLLWRNEAESRCIFIDRGRRWWVKPDGSGVLAFAGVRLPFLLEYDRGTLDGGDFAAKFAGYRAYYRAQAWRGSFDREPPLLFVCSDDRAERRVQGAARRDASTIPLLTTSDWRASASDNPSGLIGAIWSAPAGEAVGRRGLLEGSGSV